MSKQFSMYIGRWQPWHPGHRWLIEQRLKLGKNVLVCIRDVEPNTHQPWTADEISINLAKELKDLIEEGRVKVIKIPDIESINYGRGVGYEVIEHTPPQEVHDISATKIRTKMKEDGKL